MHESNHVAPEGRRHHTGTDLERLILDLLSDGETRTVDWLYEQVKASGALLEDDKLLIPVSDAYDRLKELGVDTSNLSPQEKHELVETHGLTSEPLYKNSIRQALRQLKSPGKVVAAGRGLVHLGHDLSRAPKYWVEKTIVAGRPDREHGPHALGRAMWSPVESKSGADIYSQMRDVQRGDIIFHLIDNRHIAGISIAEGPARDDFTGLKGTAWEGKCYRVPLREYEPLTPPIDRDQFLGSEVYRNRLLRLQSSHKVFFSSGLQLNQGAYLTEAPAELVEIWSEIYSQNGKRSLPHVGQVAPTNHEATVPAANKDLKEICSAFAQAVARSNVHFGDAHDAFVRAFVVSLATKGFVILTGLSGSGKTQIARCLGQWFGLEYYRVVPVRPDWTGAEALFGYEDALQAPDEQGRRPWFVPDALKAMLTAARNPDWPYLLVLDEMNLAHVERYFADVLSGMSSAEACLPNLRQENGCWRIGTPSLIAFPRNLFVVGTVNVDETTYQFSPKVLDRANTIEFRVRTSDIRDEYHKPHQVERGAPSLLRGLLEISWDDGGPMKSTLPNPEQAMQHLKTLHALLAEDNLEFGHRVIFEALRFFALLHAAGETDLHAALDLQVIQKILPRLHGSRRRIETPLRALAKYCLDLSSRNKLNERYDPEGESSTPLLPKSYDKVTRMLKSLRANQFTSFTE